MKGYGTEGNLNQHIKLKHPGWAPPSSKRRRLNDQENAQQIAQKTREMRIQLSLQGGAPKQILRKSDVKITDLPTEALKNVFKFLPVTKLNDLRTVNRAWNEAIEVTFSELQSLSLTLHPGEDNKKYVMTILSHSPNLKHLTVTTKRAMLTDEILEAVGECSQKLQSLRLCPPKLSSSYSDYGLKCVLNSCTSLTRLVLEESSQLKRFVAESSSLEVLHMNGCSHLEETELKFPQLRELALNLISAEGVQLYAPPENVCAALCSGCFRYCNNVERVFLSGSYFSNDCLARIGSHCNNVKVLQCLNSHIVSDDGVTHIIKSFPQLYYLDLANTPCLTNNALTQLGSWAAEGGPLRYLFLPMCPNLRGNPSAILNKCTKLKVLDLGRCTNLSSIDLNLPQLEKLSLWGCGGLERLQLDCISLKDLNMNECKKLQEANIRAPMLRELFMMITKKKTQQLVHRQVDHLPHLIFYAM